MSDWLTITGLHPYDGRYELDLDAQPLTTREWGYVKKHAGYLPLTLTADGFSDPELIMVLAVVAARRAGAVDTADVPRLFERLQDAPFGPTILLETDEAVEADAGPPPSSSASRPSTNGGSSPAGSETSAPSRPATGSPPSATSVSAPTTSVS